MRSSLHRHLQVAVTAWIVIALGACRAADPGQRGGPSMSGVPPFPAHLLASPERHEFGVTVRSDGREIYFGVDLGDRSEIWITQVEDGAWTEPVPFLRGDRQRYFDPYLADGGATLYFISDRPRSTDDLDPREDADIWRMSRDSDGAWAEPEPLPPPIRTDFDEFYVSIDDRGRLAFSSNRNTGEPGERDYDLYVTDGPLWEQVAVERLGTEFSSGAYEGDPLIAPDGSYVVFASFRRSGLGGSDLYVSVRDGDGWSPIVNLGPEVNTEADELCPALDPTGPWFLFTSNEDIRRVPVAILDQARHEATARSDRPPGNGSSR